MNKHFKLLTILLSVILCLSAFSLTVWAIDADGDGYDDETGEYVGGDVTEPPVYTDPVNEPTDEPTYPPTDPPSYDDPTDPPPYEDPTDSPQEPPQNSNYDDNNYFVDEPSYVGGGQSYVAPISTAPSVPLIDSGHDIDDSELSSKDWKDISANLKNAGSGANDSDDFSFIQKNTSKGDDGNWLLIIGVVLLLLSISGIVYFIASGVLLRRKLAPAAAGAVHGGGAQNRYRSNDDYDDGYKVSKKETKQKDRSRRYDTADIKLPKNKGKNRYR